jgi:hypothetical protein
VVRYRRERKSTREIAIERGRGDPLEKVLSLHELLQLA